MPALCTIVLLQEWLQRVCKSAKTIRPLGSSLLSGEEYLLLNLDHLPCRIAETLFIIKLVRWSSYVMPSDIVWSRPTAWNS